MRVAVKEGRTGALTFGAGYSSLERATIFAADDVIVLVGEAVAGLAGSAYAAIAGAAVEDGPPALDLIRERALQAFVREAIERGLLESAQDVSGGGLAVALAAPG